MTRATGASDSVRVLGIDPGTELAGWGLLEISGAKVNHVDNGVLTLGKASLAERLKKLFESLDRIIEEYRPAEVAVEGVFTARNARSALTLGHARGVTLLAAARRQLPLFEYPPATVKKAVSGSGRADKEQVQRAVQMLLDLPEPAQADAADALAVAFCHANSRPAVMGLGDKS